MAGANSPTTGVRTCDQHGTSDVSKGIFYTRQDPASLVLELVGPSVADVVASHYRDDRLPAKLARVFANQVLQGLDFLASHDIGHGGKLIRHPWMPSVLPADSTFRSPHPKLGHHNTRPEFLGRKRLFRLSWEASN